MDLGIFLLAGSNYKYTFFRKQTFIFYWPNDIIILAIGGEESILL